MAKKTQENKVVAALNQQVANWTVLYTKLHNYHWYVKGPHFFSLHTKFEELYDEANVYIDELAERILAIEGNPIATLKESLDLSVVKEAKKNLSAADMVKDLSKDFDKVIKQLEEGKATAEEADDEMTADMFLGMITNLEKHNWMLKSFLG
ncbi:DNA starvation/stationary phase protection protein [Macrococcoides bohemicum]|uniref:DNA starvation/stationary phase protection protein n=1 Tax=Macrococcoides bohemicum TaxID=1903056 RepID=A0AAE7QD75_9STAP|nr:MULTISPECIES: Dps family protein [Macrococcus]ATD31847.1 DNA starvation/stationary phase protection protein [Macrococcus sp. IME1552]MBC9875412.1 DNA starvation/stationary phase protection protein [Macrococcus bohemicus]QRN50723.1 DNA starvation/stationary phase protection protein [Macrococcus bohemicus]QYA42187.1 DNA starvation/stationary phase protection protein [Macrococcus bohemicus]QYA44565.1 DNA starvation/stationary phase protection protein [Macrococcus bohemicus]